MIIMVLEMEWQMTTDILREDKKAEAENVSLHLALGTTESLDSLEEDKYDH